MEKVGEGNRTTIGVFPPQAYHERPRLFGALEEALPVRFEPRSRGEWASLGAAVFLDGEGDPGVTVPAFVALLALVHFLREVSAEHRWTPPPLRASFIVDDPNLHWPSYGFLRYRELVAHADAHGYHVALATVPLDGWFAHPAAARLLRERADRLRGALPPPAASRRPRRARRLGAGGPPRRRVARPPARPARPRPERAGARRVPRSASRPLRPSRRLRRRPRPLRGVGRGGQ